MSPFSNLAALTLFGAMLLSSVASAGTPADARFSMLSDEEVWRRLPAAEKGSGQPLPSWAKMLAAELPRTTAAFLQLDLAQRTKSPVDPQLRAAMRWVPAHANHSSYAETCAAADARRAGLADAKIEALGLEGYPGWSVAARAALEFARKMTLDSDGVTDDEFAGLVKHFGEKQAASMVLLMAYANFQDRVLICLDAPLETGGPLPPVELTFAPTAFVSKTTPPAASAAGRLSVAQADRQGSRGRRRRLGADHVMTRFRNGSKLQRRKPTRLRIPEWDEVARNLPEGLIKRPSDIVWYRICFGYAPELAVPFEYFMRTAGAEAGSKWDRIFGSGLFWVTTKAIKCPYCMGHCEMNWEVAGLSKTEIAERSKLLAGDDWSSFPPAEQHAYAFARKLTGSPGAITGDDVALSRRTSAPTAP